MKTTKVTLPPCLSLLLLCASALAEEPTLDEVIVTAQRKEENLQAVPLSVDALTEEDLDNRALRSATDLGSAIPGLQVTSPGGQRPVFSLRGISSSDFNPNQSPPIGFYTDESYLAPSTSQGLAFFDLERVEVLKGPQGTLYGKNTTGGAISLISRSPSLTRSANNRFSAGYGNYNERRVSAAAETPLIPGRLAIRAAFDFDQDDGWFQNRNGPDMAQTDRVSGRFTVNGQLSERLNALLKLTIAQSSPLATPAQATGTVPVPGRGLFNYAGYSRPPDQDLRAGDISRVGRSLLDLNLVSLKLSYDTDSLKFISVSSGYDHRVRFGQDNDASPVSLLETDWAYDARSFSEDLRMESNWQGPFNVIAGIYVNYDEGDMNVAYRAFQSGAGIIAMRDPALAGLLSQSGIVDQMMSTSSTSTAAYSQGRYRFSERLGMDMGIRFTVDQNDLDHFNVSRLDYTGTPQGSWIPGNTSGINAGFLPPALGGTLLTGPYTRASGLQREKKDQSWSGKAGLDYALTDNALIYTSYSRGYRSGNYNPAVAYSLATYEKTVYTQPETVDAYEVGIKSDWLHERLRLNLAGYYYDYQNQQIINVIGTESRLLNAGAAHIYGLESTMLATPLQGLRVSLGSNLMQARYENLFLANNQTPAADDQLDLAGSQMNASPDFKLTGAIDYSFEPGFGGLIDLGVSGVYQTRQWFTAYNDSPGYEQTGQAPYGLMNARIAFSDNQGRYTLALHSENLLDENYIVSANSLANGFGFRTRLPGPPRRYGLDLIVRF